MDSNKTPKDMMPEDETPSMEGVKYATGDKKRAITSSLRNNEVDGTKQKQCSPANMSGRENKVQCCKEQYYIGTWNVRFMGQGKLDLFKQETAKLNIDILVNQWSKMGGNG